MNFQFDSKKKFIKDHRSPTFFDKKISNSFTRSTLNSKKMPPFRQLSDRAFNALTNNDKLVQYKRSCLSGKGRGRTIANLYHALSWALEQNNNFVPANEPNEDEPLLNPVDDLEERIQALRDRIAAEGNVNAQPLPMQCSICFDNYDDSTEKRPCVIRCGHHYCSGCFVNLTRNAVGNRKCPHCRKVISGFALMYN